jgi:hypothetical protein
VDVDTAVGGRRSSSELAVDEMVGVGVSVRTCVESSEVATQSCFTTLVGGEGRKLPGIGVAGDT